MLESKLHIITSSDLDSMTLTAVQATEANMSVTNLLDSRRGRIARWASETAITLKAERPDDLASYVGTGFGVGRHNFEEDVTIRLRLYPDLAQGGTVVYDSGALSVAVVKPFAEWRPGVDPWADTYKLADGIPKIFQHFFPDSYPYKSIQIDIVNPTGNFVDIGRLFLGLAFVPSANMNWGNYIEGVDSTENVRTAGGGRRPIEGEEFRRFNIPLGHLTTADMNLLSNLLGLVGKSGDMLISLDPTATGLLGLRNSMIGYRVSNTKYSHDRYDNYKDTLIVEEA